ncbi:arylamine N-acetyltransferase 1 [Amanita muscaria]
MEGTLRGGIYIKSKQSCYSPGQLARYLTRIQYTPKEHAEETFIADGSFPANFENLERLMRLHLMTFPLDNTAMHYAPSHAVDVDPQNLYRRFLDEKKGSYCFGQNSFVLYILRGLGYRAYNAAARVNVHRLPEPTDFPPYDHIIVFVQPISDSNITYLFDVGFSNGPSRPILLTDSDKSIVIGTTETERFRIRKRADPRSSLESRDASNDRHLDWALEVQHVNKHTPDPLTAPWIPLYPFNEDEFYENDIYNASFSYCTSSMPIHGGRLRENLVVSKFFLLDSEGNLIFDSDTAARELVNTDVSKRNLGRALLFGKELKFIRGGESETTVLKTESERIAVLKDYFGIVITDEEKGYIRGLPSAIDVE